MKFVYPSNEHEEEMWERSYPRRAKYILEVFVERFDHDYEISRPPLEAFASGRNNLYWWLRGMRNWVVFKE